MIPDQDLQKNRTPSLWRDRHFIIIVSALIISGTGSGISKIALLWMSYELTQSTTTMGMIFVCLTLPGVFAGPISGALADRYSKKNILLTARFILGIIAACFIPAYYCESIHMIFVLVFLMGGTFSFAGGPFMAYLAELFEEDKLVKVNAALQSIRSVNMLAGPALGGIILAAANVHVAFLIDALSFIISGFIMLRLPNTRRKLVDGYINIEILLHDTKEGLTYFLRSPLHRFLLFFFVSLCGTYCISGGLIMPLCNDVLSLKNNMEGSTVLAILETTFGLGSLIGSFLIPSMMRKYGYMPTLMVGAYLCVIELLAYGTFFNIFILVAITSITAVSMPMLIVPLMTLMQQKTDKEFLGRVMGAFDTLLLSVISLAFGIGGVLAGEFGLTTVFVSCGIFMLVTTSCILCLPQYWRLHRNQES